MKPAQKRLGTSIKTLFLLHHGFLEAKTRRLANFSKRPDTLEQKLIQMTSIIEDLAYQIRLISNPDSQLHAVNLYNNILAETTQLKKELKDIKSKVSKTI
jgi:hypothetical protein